MEHRAFSEPWIVPGKNNDINELQGIFLNCFFTSRVQTGDPGKLGQEGRNPVVRSAALAPKGIGARNRMRRGQGMARIFVIRANLLGLSARGGQAGLLPIGASTASSRTFIRVRRYPDRTPRIGPVGRQ